MRSTDRQASDPASSSCCWLGAGRETPSPGWRQGEDGLRDGLEEPVLGWPHPAWDAPHRPLAALLRCHASVRDGYYRKKQPLSSPRCALSPSTVCSRRCTQPRLPLSTACSRRCSNTGTWSRPLLLLASPESHHSQRITLQGLPQGLVYDPTLSLCCLPRPNPGTQPLQGSRRRRRSPCPRQPALVNACIP